MTNEANLETLLSRRTPRARSNPDDRFPLPALPRPFLALLSAGAQLSLPRAAAVEPSDAPRSDCEWVARRAGLPRPIALSYAALRLPRRS